MRLEHPVVGTKVLTSRHVEKWTLEEDAILLKETLECEEEYGKKA